MLDVSSWGGGGRGEKGRGTYFPKYDFLHEVKLIRGKLIY